MPKRNNPRHESGSTDRQRALVAQSAARLVAEGLNDLAAAKLKAARQLAIPARAELPTDAEVREALEQHLALFAPQDHDTRVRELRLLALGAMEKFDAFGPWLYGALLENTATVHSEIELLFYGVEPKQFEIHLNSHGIAYSTLQDQPGCDEPTVRLMLSFRNVPVLCTLCPKARAPTHSSRKDAAQAPRLQLKMAKAFFALAGEKLSLSQES